MVDTYKFIDHDVKWCCSCNKLLNIGEFSKQTSAKDGRQGKCKKCFRIYQRARKYGLSEKHFRLLLISQNYECAICGKKDRSLVVDHNHTTGKVRGLLCSHCNTGIGMLQDSVEIIRRAEGYLIHDT